MCMYVRVVPLPASNGWAGQGPVCTYLSGCTCEYMYHLICMCVCVCACVCVCVCVWFLVYYICNIYNIWQVQAQLASGEGWFSLENITQLWRHLGTFRYKFWILKCTRSSEFNLVNILGYCDLYDYGAIWALSVTSVPNILKSELRECVLLLQCVLFQWPQCQPS